MPNKIVATIQGIRKILQEPFLLNDYEEALREERTYRIYYAEEAKKYITFLQSYENAIALSKEIAPQIYFDRESGLLQSFQYIYIDLQNRQPIFKMSHGEFTLESFQRKLVNGELEPMTQEQVAEKGQWPRSIESLKQAATESGLEMWWNIEFPPMIKIQGTALCMNDWQAAEDLIASVQQNSVCGILVFMRGADYSIYTDPQKYVRAYKDELDTRGPAGVKDITLSKDPALHKEMDDIKWGYVGEENPHDLEHYQKKYASAAEAVAENQSNKWEKFIHVGQKFFCRELDRDLKKSYDRSLDHMEEYESPEELDELLNRTPPQGTIEIEDISQGPTGKMIYTFLGEDTEEEFLKRLESGFFVPVQPQQQQGLENAERSPEEENEELEL